MKIKRLVTFGGVIFLALLIVNLSGIFTNPPVTGTVVDSNTMRPIEGAVVMIEWTKTHGIGEHWTESYKVAEAVTDKDGKFTLPGCYSTSVDKPDVTIYKKGYVAWSSRWIFPDWRNRTDFKWGDGTFSLEHFRPEYSYTDHTDFIEASINSSLEKNYVQKKPILLAIEWEQEMASQERTKKNSKVSLKSR